jgi:2-(1,2-epoxy-1,2-dihydrophenyl)acetyl-CoA isomerase
MRAREGGSVDGIEIERDGGVGILSFERPERLNAMDVPMAQAFRKGGLQLARDEAVRAIVVRGAGGVFSAGADLRYVRAGGDAVDLGYLRPAGREEQAGFGAAFQQILEYLHSGISELRRAPKPVVAAVDGVAAAGGFGIAMACDLVFASERARFEWAYGRTGLTGAESSTFLLPRLLGFRRAMDLMLRSPRLDAARALALGLVSEVFPAEGFDERVRAEARRLAEGPTAAFGVAKALLNRAAGLDQLEGHLALELEELTRIAEGGDFAAGLASFFEKRPARFGGR